MKKIFNSIAIALGILSLSSCADFLDVKKYGADTSWKTKDDVRQAVNALYSIVSNDEAEGVTGRGIAWFECCSDNVTVGRPQAQGNQIRNFQMTADNGRDVKHVWRRMYVINAQANNIIRLVPAMDLNQDFKNLAIGTAYFWRGLAMLWLAPYYGDGGYNGGIPIILDTTDPSKMDVARPASVLMNYDQIISDFNRAAELLPYFSGLADADYGLPHKAAAWAFAARAAMYASQWDAKYYQTMIEECNRVMNLTGADKRDLYKDRSGNSFANLWTRANNFSSEYLFSLLGNATDGPKYHGMSFNNGGWGLYNTWGYYQPTQGLYDAFETGDTRRDDTILYPGQHIQYVGKDVYFGSAQYGISSETGMTFRKFMSPWKEADCIGKEVNTNTDDASNTLGTCLIRYADVLLMKAEALIWTKGEGDAEAKDLINQVRVRAGLPANSQATKAQLKNERRCELAFEFMPARHLDLVRWGDAKDVYARPTLGVKSHYDAITGKVVIDGTFQFDNGRTFDTQKNQVFPIPAAAFDGTVNLKQNKGYE